MRDEGSALGQVIELFEKSCDTFARLVVNADEVADAVDFTGKLHDLSLAAGRVQGLADALFAFTGAAIWRERAEATLREYLGSSGAHESNGHGGHQAGSDLEALEG